MASISISCTCSSVSSSALTRLRATPSQQSIAALCVPCRALGDGFIGRNGRGSADVVRRRHSTKQRIFGGHLSKVQREMWRLDVGLKETALTEKQWGPPVSLGTAQLPLDVDVNKLQTLMYQWGTNLTQNANLPLPTPLKVDRVEGGVRLGYIKVVDGKVEDIVHIDVIVTPASDEQPKAMFRAIRNGQMKNSVPPGEPLIMQSLLAALKISLPLARPSS